MSLALRPLAATDRETWDALVASDGASGFGQSWSWADFKEREGHLVERLGVFLDDRLVAGALVHRYPSAERQTVLFVPDGPVVPWQDDALARSSLRLLLGAAGEIAGRERAIALRIEPHLQGSRPAALKEFVRAPLDVYPQHTLLVDARLGDAELLGGMRPKGRYNIRLAARHGVQVTSVPALQNLRRFYALFNATAHRDEFFAEPYGYFINLAETLSSQGMLRLYLATHDGDDLAAALIVYFGDRATFLYGGSADHKRNLMASYALQWTAVREAREAGVATYDFYGYEPYGLADHPYAGFSRFKRQFGGRPVRYLGAQDFVFYAPLADALVAGLVELQTISASWSGRS